MSYLKAGDWSIHANGIRGTLRVNEIDELGRVSGTLFDEPIVGWWSERARRLAFVRERASAGPTDKQGFEGYAWDEPSDVGLPRVYYLAGSYETFGGGGGAKDRQSFGWFAISEASTARRTPFDVTSRTADLTRSRVAPPRAGTDLSSA